ncbi:MAG: hypothetical protein PHQ12_13265 [Chthoniobacteraceae bacterium]|nr:hypothetical protein [Chthoniobacteraceae bacterium]
MIAFADGMPLVQLDDGRAVAFQREWIVRALARAAFKAGFSKWWLAAHVTESVALSLAAYYQGNVISVPRLTERIRDALQAIGYSEIGRHLALGMPGERLDLAVLAREAGAGYELAFFNRLREQLRSLIGAGTTEVDVVGLAPCVKQLRSRKSWSRSCEALQEEIVSFVRTQTAADPAKRELSVQVR